MMKVDMMIMTTFEQFFKPLNKIISSNYKRKNDSEEKSKTLYCDWCGVKVAYIENIHDPQQLTSKKVIIQVNKDEIIHICGKRAFCMEHIIEHVRYIPCPDIP